MDGSSAALAGAAAKREMEEALSRGTLYAALAHGFRPPDEDGLIELFASESIESLCRAGAELEIAAPAERALEAFASADEEPERLRAAHRRLFGHTARGEVPAYETEYGNEALFQQPQELSDLAGFMLAFGLELRPETHERLDHVSCECEFLAFLSWKEGWAIEARDAEMLATTRHAERLFLRDHLGRFAPAFARRLREADSGLYRALGELLLGLVTQHSGRLGVAVGSDALGLRPDPAAVAAPSGCGIGGEGVCASECQP